MLVGCANWASRPHLEHLAPRMLGEAEWLTFRPNSQRSASFERAQGAVAVENTRVANADVHPAVAEDSRADVQPLLGVILLLCWVQVLPDVLPAFEG